VVHAGRSGEFQPVPHPHLQQSSEPPPRITSTEAAIAIEALPTGVILLGRDWSVRLVNSAAARQLSRTPANLIGRDARETLPWLEFATAPAATMADGVTRSMTLRLDEDPDVLTLLRVARSNDDGIVLQLEDSSESGATAAEEHEENEALRNLARQMAGVAETRELLIALTGAASSQCRSSGAAVIEVAGEISTIHSATGVLQPMEGQAFPLHGSLAERAIAAEGPVLEVEFGADDFPLAGSLLELGAQQVLLAPLLADERVLGVLVVVRPAGAALFSSREVQRLQVIADHAALALWKAHLLEQAQLADRAKSRFLATISHELRTPITALSGYAELIADGVLGPLSEQQREILDRMMSVTHRLWTMIEEILAYSNLEEGHEVVRASEFLAGDLVHAVVTTMEPVALDKQLALAWSVPSSPIRLTSDLEKARDILLHLIGNAIKFTDAGEVRVRVEPTVDEVMFIVADTGIGIAPDDLGRLFDPFVQLDTGLTRRHGGTGLGLHIAQRLATMIRGRVDVQSVPGEGSEFALVIPRGAL
jgi:signal transduction histidine kinase/PAS domain-containing protein